MNFVKSMLGKMTPQQMAMNMIKNNSNLMMNNLFQMAQKGDNQGIENFARNICKERGLDFDKEYSQFINQLKG